MEDLKNRINIVYRILGVILIFLLAVLVLNSGVVPGLSKRADKLKVFAVSGRDDQTILPGDVYDRNGTELYKTYTKTVLETVKDGEGKEAAEKKETVIRVTEYPQGKLYSQLIGYTGAKNRDLQAENPEDVVKGRNDYRMLKFLDDDTFWEEKGNIGLYVTPDIDGRKGQSVFLTIDNKVQEKVNQAMSRQMNDENDIGSVVVLDVKTGEIIAMLSYPSYDFNNMKAATEKMKADELRLESGAPVSYKNAESSGSIFKVLMTICLLDHGMEDLKVNDEPFQVGEWTCKNAYSYNAGEINYKTALEKSSNVFFATAAMELGAKRLQETADKFGLKENTCKCVPADSEEFEDKNKDGKDDHFKDRDKDGICDDTQNISLDFGSMKYNWDLNVDDAVFAQTGFGQGKTELTTLHAAMIAQAVANDGVMLKPYLIKKMVDVEGKTVYEGKTEVYSNATRKSTADKVTEAMVLAAQYGTKGNTAVLFEKYQVAGKTGTAQTGNAARPNNAWFLSFAPADNPQYVVVANHCKVKKSGAQLKSMVAEIYEYLFENYQNVN